MRSASTKSIGSGQNPESQAGRCALHSNIAKKKNEISIKYNSERFSVHFVSVSGVNT